MSGPGCSHQISKAIDLAEHLGLLFRRDLFADRILLPEAGTDLHFKPLSRQEFLNRAYHSRRHSGRKLAVRDVMGHDAARPDDDVVANPHAGQDDSSRSQEHAIADRDLPDPCIVEETSRARVMGKDMYVRCQGHVVADPDQPAEAIIDDAPWSHPEVLAHN